MSPILIFLLGVLAGDVVSLFTIALLNAAADDKEADCEDAQKLHEL